MNLVSNEMTFSIDRLVQLSLITKMSHLVQTFNLAEYDSQKKVSTNSFNLLEFDFLKVTSVLNSYLYRI